MHHYFNHSKYGIYSKKGSVSEKLAAINLFMTLWKGYSKDGNYGRSCIRTCSLDVSIKVIICQCMHVCLSMNLKEQPVFLAFLLSWVTYILSTAGPVLWHFRFCRVIPRIILHILHCAACDSRMEHHHTRNAHRPSISIKQHSVVIFWTRRQFCTPIKNAGCFSMMQMNHPDWLDRAKHG